MYLSTYIEKTSYEFVYSWPCGYLFCSRWIDSSKYDDRNREFKLHVSNLPDFFLNFSFLILSISTAIYTDIFKNTKFIYVIHIYFLYHSNVLEIIPVQNINWLYSRSSIYWNSIQVSLIYDKSVVTDTNIKSVPRFRNHIATGTCIYL